MAKAYVGVNNGSGVSGVLTGTSTTSAAVEIVIDDTKIMSRREAYVAIDQIKAFLASSRTWPLAS